MDSTSGVLRGRPYGGLAIMWRKSLGGCKIIDMSDKRLMCIEVDNSDKCLFFINVYMPVDGYDNLDEFLSYLAKLNSYVEELNSPYVAFFGDFNANCEEGKSSLFGKELARFCKEENFSMADQTYCPASSFTFFQCTS